MNHDEPITITLPAEVARAIDRVERDQARFVLEAVRRELERRRRERLRDSLSNPHPDGRALAEEGFDDWAAGLPKEDPAGLIDPHAGTAVRWFPGEGWVEAC